MFKAKIKSTAVAVSFAFVFLLTLGAVRNLSAQQTNPGAQISGAVTFGHCTSFGPGVGQIQDSGAACASGAVTSVFGRVGAVIATAGDYSFALISGTLTCAQFPVSVFCTVISTPTTVFVGAAQSGTNNCLSAGQPCSNAKAMALVSSWINNSVTTIQFQDGSYVGTPFTPTAYVGTGSIALQGNLVTPDNVNFANTVGGPPLFNWNYVGGTWTMHGFKLSSSAGTANNGSIFGQGNALLTIGNIDFGSMAVAAQISCGFGFHVENDAPLTITGGAAYFAQAVDGGVCHVGTSQTVTISNTPAYTSQFISAHGAGGVVGITTANFTPSQVTVGSISYEADDSGVLDINGALSSIPGSGTGVLASGGIANGNSAFAALTATSLGTSGSVQAGTGSFSTTDTSPNSNALRMNQTFPVLASANAIACPATTRGLIMVSDVSVSGIGALFFIAATGNIVALSVGGSLWSNTTTPAASHFGFAWDGTNFRVYNGFASNVSIQALSVSSD